MTDEAMSATEELRRMLDERGVEWVDTGNGSMLIPAQAATNVAWDVNIWPSGKDMGDCLWMHNRHPLTPEQAIATTLGQGTCTLPETCVDHGSIEYNGVTEWRECSACGEEVLAYPANFCPSCGRRVKR